MERYFRVFKFMGQVLAMGQQNPRLFVPLALNLGIALPVNLALVILLALIGDANPSIAWVLNALGIVSLYYIDYFCNGLTASMIFDQVTTGNATLSDGVKRTLRSAVGILIFATISGIFDLLSSYAQERDDILGRILLGIVRSVWTMATYVVMPSMVIEGIGFGAAFKRSKDLAANDPTNVGSGIVGMGLASYLISVVGFGIAQFAFMNLGGIAGLFIALTMTNLVWALTGYLKITYFTCFYLWARECATRGQANPQFAPAPLAAALS